MKTSTWPIGKRAAVALGIVVCCGTAGCAFFPHRELTAPCSDYKAVRFTPAAGAAASVPCDEPLPMARPPWTAALQPPTGTNGSTAPPTVIGVTEQARPAPTG